MKTNTSQPYPFDPPPVPDGSSYVLFQGDVVPMVARWQVKRMRAAGIDAYWETNRSFTGGAWGAGNTYEWLCSVCVAQPHLICAMILWKLGFRGVKGWQKMSHRRRCRLAGKALVGGMLLRGEEWDQGFFTPTGLSWLQAQLGLHEEAFQRLLGQARRGYMRIGKRDLRWGLWLSAGCLGVGGLWWLAGSFGWPVLILLVLGVVFGVHTLAVSLPRARRSGTLGLGASHPSLEAIRARLHRSPQDEAYGRKQTVAPPHISKPYLDFGRCLEEATGFLNQGDAKSALNILETFAGNDYRGIHTAYPEFYEILRACQQSLGLKTLRAESQIEEMQLDWMTALTKGQQLLKAGRAKESIAYFNRSLKANPGEAGTASAVEEARLGIKSAEALLKRRKKPWW